MNKIKYFYNSTSHIIKAKYQFKTLYPKEVYNLSTNM